ncbi:unnamed protein product [Urochloa humidicola]
MDRRGAGPAHPLPTASCSRRREELEARWSTAAGAGRGGAPPPPLSCSSWAARRRGRGRTQEAEWRCESIGGPPACRRGDGGDRFHPAAAPLLRRLSSTPLQLTGRDKERTSGRKRMAAAAAPSTRSAARRPPDPRRWRPRPPLPASARESGLEAAGAGGARTKWRGRRLALAAHGHRGAPRLLAPSRLAIRPPLLALGEEDQAGRRARKRRRRAGPCAHGSRGPGHGCRPPLLAPEPPAFLPHALRRGEGEEPGRASSPARRPPELVSPRTAPWPLHLLDPAAAARLRLRALLFLPRLRAETARSCGGREMGGGKRVRWGRGEGRAVGVKKSVSWAPCGVVVGVE